jgi:hypothetical protein
LGAVSSAPAVAAPVNPDCTTLTNPVYLASTTLIETFLAEVAPVLADPAAVGADHMTVLHFPLSSCISYETHMDRSRSRAPRRTTWRTARRPTATCPSAPT